MCNKNKVLIITEGVPCCIMMKIKFGCWVSIQVQLEFGGWVECHLGVSFLWRE